MPIWQGVTRWFSRRYRLQDAPSGPPAAPSISRHRYPLIEFESTAGYVIERQFADRCARCNRRDKLRREITDPPCPGAPP